MKTSRPHGILSSLLVLLLVFALLPVGAVMSAESPQKLVFKPTQNVGNPNAEVFAYNSGLTFSALGSEGLRVAYDGSADAGYSNVIFAFPSQALQTTPYLTLKADLAGAPDGAVSLFAAYTFGVAGVPQVYAMEPFATFEVTQTLDLREILKNETDSVGFVYLDLYVASPTAANFDFVKFYLSSERERETFHIPFKSTATANYKDGGHYGLTSGMTVSDFGEGLSFTGTAEDRAIYAFDNVLLGRAPYLIVEPEPEDIGKLEKIVVTKMWDGGNDKVLTVEPRLNVYDLNALLKDDATIGYFYVAVTTKGTAQAPETVRFRQICLTSELPAEADTAVLRDAVEQASNLNLDRYLDNAAKDDFRKALDEARTVLLNPYAAQEEVDAVLAALREAQGKLVLKADLKPLRQLVNELKYLSPSAYTKESYGGLDAVIKEAEALIEGNNATQEQVDAVIAKLNDAKNKLVPKASGKYMVLKHTKSADEGADGGWYDQNPGLSYAKYGDFGIRIQYEGGNFSNVLWAIPTSVVNKMPYLILETGSRTYDGEVPSITLQVGYNVGAEHADLYSMTPVSSVRGVQAFNIKELLKDKRDEFGFVYINLYVVSAGPSTVDLNRWYLSSTDADRSRFYLPFIPTQSDGSLVDGGWYAKHDSITVEKNEYGSVTISGEEGRVVWAFPNGLLNSARYLVYEIVDDGPIDNINLTKMFDDNKPNHLMDTSPGVHKIDLNELFRNDTETQGYFYVTVTIKSGAAVFKSLYLTDGSVVDDGTVIDDGGKTEDGEPHNPQTADRLHPVLRLAFFAAPVAVFAARRKKVR